MGSSSNSYEERMGEELEELFGPERELYGETFENRLSEDSGLRDVIRERLERGEASGDFPLLSDFLSTLSAREKEIFFRTGGKGLGSSSTIDDAFENSERLGRIQILLRDQPEFETRYPAPYELLFPQRARSADRAGMYL